MMMVIAVCAAAQCWEIEIPISQPMLCPMLAPGAQAHVAEHHPGAEVQAVKCVRGRGA